MKRRIFICLFVLLLMFFITGCGTKKEETNNKNNNNSQENQKKSKSEEENNTVIMDDEIIELDDEDNKQPEGNLVVKEVVNCDGCVYAYFSDEGDKAKTIGSTLSTDEYTKDINKLKTKGGKQRKNFFGLVLSGNTISRAYACILKDEKIYCIEGSTNGAYQESNISILNQIFTEGQCKTISNGNTYTCTDGSYNGDTQTTGYTSMHYDTSCTIYGSDSNTGKLICH